MNSCYWLCIIKLPILSELESWKGIYFLCPPPLVPVPVSRKALSHILSPPSFSSLSTFPHPLRAHARQAWWHDAGFWVTQHENERTKRIARFFFRKCHACTRTCLPSGLCVNCADKELHLLADSSTSWGVIAQKNRWSLVTGHQQVIGSHAKWPSVIGHRRLRGPTMKAHKCYNISAYVQVNITLQHWWRTFFARPAARKPSFL